MRNVLVMTPTGPVFIMEAKDFDWTDPEDFRRAYLAFRVREDNLRRDRAEDYPIVHLTYDNATSPWYLVGVQSNGRQAQMVLQRSGGLYVLVHRSNAEEPFDLFHELVARVPENPASPMADTSMAALSALSMQLSLP